MSRSQDRPLREFFRVIRHPVVRLLLEGAKAEKIRRKIEKLAN